MSYTRYTYYYKRYYRTRYPYRSRDNQANLQWKKSYVPKYNNKSGNRRPMNKKGKTKKNK